MERKLKVILTVLLIILISLISFGGIFVKKANNYKDIVPEYKLGMDLVGGRIVTLSVDDKINTVIYDKDGNVVNEEGDGTTKKEEPVNKQESLTKSNYIKSKEIIEKRLKEMGALNYTIRLDENTGKMYIQIPEEKNTDMMAQYTLIKGDFSIVNDENKILLDRNHIKKAQVGYSSVQGGTAVFLTINFDEEGTKVLKDISNTYKVTKDEEGKDNSKKISVRIDDQTLMSTAFEEEIPNGTLQMNIGSPSNDKKTIQGYVTEASNMATLLNNGTLPITYKMEENKYIKSDISKDMFNTPIIIIGIAILIAIIWLIVKYKKNGVIAGLSLIGYIAVLLLVIRYTNVILTIEGFVGILMAIIMDIISLKYLLQLMQNKENKTREDTVISFKEALMKTLFVLIPALITSVVMCFVSWLPVFSFGMVMFWGIVIIVIYNLVITKTLIINTTKNEE